MELIPHRTLHDRGSIAPRSRFDRTAIVEFFHEASGLSDEASKMMDGPITIHTVLLDHQDREKSQPSNDSIKINPRWRSDALERLHVAIGRPLIASTYSIFFNTCFDGWSRGLGSTRSMISPRSDARRVATLPAKGKTCGTMSHTGKKMGYDAVK